MKLYLHPASPFVRKVTVAAALLGLKLETQFVDLFSGEGQTPEFLQLNPNGKVPTLVDGDFALWESNAITQYLASHSPDSALIPADAKGRADVLRWQFWETSSWSPACAIYIYENVLKPMMGRGEADPEELKKADEKFHRLAKILDAQLATRSWLVGEALTLADVSVAAALMYAESAHYPLSEYVHIKKWFNTICKLPEWISTEPPAA